MPVTVQRVVECVREMEKTQEKLTLIVGKPGSGKSKVLRELATMRGWKYVDCRTLVTDELLELVPKARPAEAPAIMDHVLDAYRAEVILLDGLQILFTPFLHLEPLSLLKRLSRKHRIVAAWTGDYADGKLTFVRENQSDRVEYPADGLKIIHL